MDTSSRISRRELLQGSVGALAVVASGSAAKAAVPTPAQTEGPFFPTQDQTDKDIDLTRIAGHEHAAKGEVFEISGQVFDTEGKPLAGALVDVWQANSYGRYAHERDPNPAPLDPDFQGWARFITDADGRYRIRTIKPGAYPVGEGWSRPPHLHFKVALRGFHELTTQMYFAGDPLNDVDRILQAVPEPERASLVVQFASDPAQPDRAPLGRFDLVLRRA